MGLRGIERLRGRPRRENFLSLSYPFAPFLFLRPPVSMVEAEQGRVGTPPCRDYFTKQMSRQLSASCWGTARGSHGGSSLLVPGVVPGPVLQALGEFPGAAAAPAREGLSPGVQRKALSGRVAGAVPCTARSQTCCGQQETFR